MTDRDGGLSGRVASSTDDADRDVLARVSNGELDALQDLYDRYRTMAYSIALRITADSSLESAAKILIQLRSLPAIQK